MQVLTWTIAGAVGAINQIEGAKLSEYRQQLTRALSVDSFAIDEGNQARVLGELA